MTHTTDKKQINEAIYTVLTTQFKKNAKDAHQLVEAEGYQISKFDGSWQVRNNETGRKVWIQYSRGTGFSYLRGNGNSRIHKFADDFSKFDCVGYLDKPLNDEWNEMNSYRFQENRFKQSADVLHSARWDVDYHTRQLASIQKQIEKLQEELVYHAGWKVKAEQKLVETRKNLGLLK